MKTMMRLSLLIVSLAAAMPLLAQATGFYKLDFVIKEVEAGKVVNSRNFSSMIAVGSYGSIRTGGRTPVTTGTASGTNPLVNTQYSFFDTGVNIDFKDLREMTDRLALQVSVDVTSIPPTSETPNLPPTTRQNRWSSFVVVPLGKPTMVHASDDLASKRQLQVELTATAVK